MVFLMVSLLSTLLSLLWFLLWIFTSSEAWEIYINYFCIFLFTFYTTSSSAFSRILESSVPEDAEIEPKTVTEFSLTVRAQNNL
jgi:hypothetical protein